MLPKINEIAFLLERQQEALNHFFKTMAVSALENFIHTLQFCQGTLVFSGVGKSALVAEKIAMTLSSTGSKAFFLSPTNALHGDIGMTSAQDIVIMLSKSGESEELLQLVPFIRNRGIKIGAILTNPHSRLAKAADFTLILPNEKELCPFDIAPTTSAVIQMMIGDILAIALMKLKKFSLDDYAKNHPAGRIGRRLIIRIKDLMIKEAALPLCRGEDKLFNILVELSNKRCGCILVTNEQLDLQGIFTDGDLRRALQQHGATALDFDIKNLMNSSPQFISHNELAWDALHLMEADQKHPIMVLPVLDENKKLCGLIKMHDIVQAGL